MSAPSRSKAGSVVCSVYYAALDSTGRRNAVPGSTYGTEAGSDATSRQCTSTGNASEGTGRQVAIGNMTVNNSGAVVLQDVAAGYGSNGQGSPL